LAPHLLRYIYQSQTRSPSVTRVARLPSDQEFQVSDLQDSRFELMQEMTEELSVLKQRLIDLEHRTQHTGTSAIARAEVSGPPALAQEQAFGRRLLLRRVGTVAAGAAAASVASGLTRPAAAGTGIGGVMNIGDANISTTANTPQTLLKVTSLVSTDQSIFAVSDGATATSARRAAIIGIGGSQVNTGIAGVSTNTSTGVGVLGQGRVAFGAASNTTHLKLTDATGSVTALPLTTSLLSSVSLGGEITLDRSFNLWFGASGSWRKLAGPESAGAFHAIDPWRAYDSRPGAGPLIGGGSSRVITIATGSPVPTGVRAVVGMIAVVNTTATGWLTIASGDTASTSSSSINWFGADQVLNNAMVTKVTNGQIKMFNNSPGNANFVIDITGYYL
jgi:hypothetical protein